MWISPLFILTGFLHMIFKLCFLTSSSRFLAYHFAYSWAPYFTDFLFPILLFPLLASFMELLICFWSLYYMLCCVERSRSVVSDSVTPWTVAHQAPLSMEFSRQENWGRQLLSSPGDLPIPRTEPTLLCLLHWQADSLPPHHLGSPLRCICLSVKLFNTTYIN